MKIKRSLGENVYDTFNIVGMLLLMIVTAYPMYYVVMASLSDGTALLRHRGLLVLPLKFTTSSFVNVFKNPNIWNGYKNTLFLLAVGIPINIIMSSLGAYFLSRKNVLLSTPITMYIIFTMFFSGGLIPFYLNLRDLNLMNTLWGLIIPFSVSTYNMIILRTAFSGIPESLEESARLDGAGHITILFRIILPLSGPTIAVLVLYYGVGYWNGWFWASAILRNRSLYPLQVILREILINNDTKDMVSGAGADQEAVGEAIKFATIVVSTAPILFLYPFLQRYFVKGVMIGAVKG